MFENGEQQLRKKIQKIQRTMEPSPNKDSNSLLIILVYCENVLTVLKGGTNMYFEYVLVALYAVLGDLG